MKHESFKDNKRVESDRQRGIERVLQKDNKKAEGHSGEMHMSPKNGGSFKRSGESLTPRKA